MTDSRVVAWFSCGAASAVAAKLAIEKYQERAVIVHCDTLASEHPDNARFFEDVQRWLGREIIRIKSQKYTTIDEVFEARKYLAGIAGAPCTVELKKVPRFEFQEPEDVHVFGLTAEEGERIARMELTNPELQFDWLLRDRGYNKKRCFRVIEQAGLKLPAAYQYFENANCIGCVKATSPHYWAKVRLHFPEVFARRADQSRRFGARLARVNGERVFIDEIPPERELALWANIEPVAENLSCGPQCG